MPNYNDVPLEQQAQLIQREYCNDAPLRQRAAMWTAARAELPQVADGFLVATHRTEQAEWDLDTAGAGFLEKSRQTQQILDDWDGRVAAADPGPLLDDVASRIKPTWEAVREAVENYNQEITELGRAGPVAPDIVAGIEMKWRLVAALPMNGLAQAANTARTALEQILGAPEWRGVDAPNEAPLPGAPPANGGAGGPAAATGLPGGGGAGALDASVPGAGGQDAAALDAAQQDAAAEGGGAQNIAMPDAGGAGGAGVGGAGGGGGGAGGGGGGIGGAGIGGAGGGGSDPSLAGGLGSVPTITPPTAMSPAGGPVLPPLSGGAALPPLSGGGVPLIPPMTGSGGAAMTGLGAGGSTRTLGSGGAGGAIGGGGAGGGIRVPGVSLGGGSGIGGGSSAIPVASAPSAAPVNPPPTAAAPTVQPLGGGGGGGAGGAGGGVPPMMPPMAGGAGAGGGSGPRSGAAQRGLPGRGRRRDGQTPGLVGPLSGKAGKADVHAFAARNRRQTEESDIPSTVQLIDEDLWQVEQRTAPANPVRRAHL